MSKQQPQSGLMPRLRFPEFREAGEWKTRQLGQLGDVLMCKRIFADQTNDQGGVPFFKIGTLGGRPDAFIRNELFEEYKSKYNYPRKGEILITCSGTVGKCLSFDGENAYFQDSNIVWIDNPTLEISNEMLLSLLLTIDWGRLNSTTITRIYGSDLRNLSLTFPATPDEQQKIADCLSSLDTLIAAQADKLDALKTHKKGLMQQLFPREGETVPCLRFPEFRGAGEWEQTNLEQLVDFRSGGTPSKANPAFWSGSIPWVSAKDMKQLFLDDTEDHISTVAVDDGAKMASPGTLLMLTRGMTLLKDVPICVLQRGMSFNQDVKALRPKKDMDGLFLAFSLLANLHRLLKMVDIAGHGTGKLNTDELKLFELVRPQSDEQQKIANCLSSLDTLIAAQSDKFDALKTHKKGLMQQLFPSPEA